MKRLLGLGLALCIAGTACDKKEEPTSRAATAPSNAAPTSTTIDTAGTEQPVAATDESDIPTEQDFEDEAETEITASNLETELDNLEKEIGQ